MERNELYRKKIIKQLYFHKILSCAALSLSINKSIPLTTKILNELIEDGYVLETGYAASTGGRRPIMYSLKADVMYTVSVGMDQFVTRIVIMDMHNHFATEVEKMELPLAKNNGALALLTEKIDQVIYRSGIPKNKIAGVGIGMPGFIDFKKGINYSFLPTAGKSIAQHISDVIELPVYIDNDSSLIALAELRFGAARNKSNALVVNIGWGVGLGMIISNELFRGHNGFAGEFSHIPLFENNKLCSCGKSGCLETEASMLVVMEKAKEALSKGRVSTIKEITPDFEETSTNIINAALNGDQLAMELMSETAYNVGRGIAILIHIMNPELIVISGRGALAGNMLLAPIQQVVNKYCIPRLAAHTEIVVSSFSSRAELIGGAELVIENYDKKYEKSVLKPML